MPRDTRTRRPDALDPARPSAPGPPAEHAPAIAAARFAARAHAAADRPAAAAAPARARRDRRHLLAAVRVQPAQRRPAGHVGLRPRRAAHRPLDPGPHENSARVETLSPDSAPTFVADLDRQMPELAGRLRHAGRAALPLAQGTQRARAAGDRLRRDAPAVRRSTATTPSRSPTRSWPRSNSSVSGRRRSCSATCASSSTSSRQPVGDAQSVGAASTSSVTAPTVCSAPIARRSGSTIGARVTWCCRPRRIPSTSLRGVAA